MHTDAQPPHKIFNMPQQFLVPLFQRRYRWGEEKQWEPLWNDVERVTERLLNLGKEKVNPHFLGAIVLQFVENPTGSLQEKTIIDGQQRLTTLQLLMDAVQGELAAVGANLAAARLATLVENDPQFREREEQRFKVRPTHEDRPQFEVVMGAEPPIDYGKIRKSLTPEGFKGVKKFQIVDAHEFFAAKCKEWLTQKGDEAVTKRGEMLDRVLREYLLLVVIDLSADENSQEIFETLNSRGVELTAADLIKNFVFQQLRPSRSEAEIEAVYNKYWRDFDKLAFWDEDEALGRLSQKRSSAFLGYWLTSQTGEKTELSEVFYRFKRLVQYELDIPIEDLLTRVKSSSETYRKLVEASFRKDGDLSRSELFMYRIKALESNLAKSVILTLLDTSRELPEQQVHEVLDAVESWIVRRAILQRSTKRYNYVFAGIVRIIRASAPEKVADSVVAYLRGQTAETSYWPDDDEVRQELLTRNMYRRQARSRMMLEAVEDHFRGWRKSNQSTQGNPQVGRMRYTIEHIIPQEWVKHWPLKDGVAESERNRNVQLFGNLSLVTKKLNSALSNATWGTKKDILVERDIGFMNKRIVHTCSDSFGDMEMLKRNAELTEIVLGIWPTPNGHKIVAGASKKTRAGEKISIAHLLEFGYLMVGQVLYPRSGKYSGRIGEVTDQGEILLDGKTFQSPRGAAVHLTGKRSAGWKFWLVNEESKLRLWDVRQQYLDSLEPDLETDESDDDDDEDSDDEGLLKNADA
jgi:hypothetical protein